jgi:hypothetical protein
MEKSSEEYEESAIIRYAGQRFQVPETHFTIFIVCATAAHYFDHNTSLTCCPLQHKCLFTTMISLARAIWVQQVAIWTLMRTGHDQGTCFPEVGPRSRLQEATYCGDHESGSTT